ncbi:MAG: hypothetical protein QMC02_08495, partial [Halioglobus sp.]
MTGSESIALLSGDGGERFLRPFASTLGVISMLSLSQDWLELRSNVVVRLSLLGATEIGEAQAIVTCG